MTEVPSKAASPMDAASGDAPQEARLTDATDCGAMIVIRPDRQGGVIFRCTRQAGHASEHTNGGMAEEWPLVENTADLPFLVRWAR